MNTYKNTPVIQALKVSMHQQLVKMLKNLKSIFGYAKFVKLVDQTMYENNQYRFGSIDM